ncbi:tRNA-specific adenosine deaminase [Enterobacteriaceae endosymbiont of Donacia cincticornis]|uniref:tRNA adenosine(34) deaminase TadA n=1 Tax=Enterobacteriaceae endosymbiont of Donacia cincticornis TaxID=2675773 RepID=UPI001449279B|nr:tRNA adenosine(34) deaminase TadA [Enterobacteriaceae endosymbiont of Donacia cincticornis]QJC35947.1 tRNA-specific adenosine deaminase [Enterobacteriaceae endosymbiont of Donacia cincticornis]
MKNHIYWMKCALNFAKLAESFKEVPVGAIIIKKNRIISYGINSSIKNNDPTGHAEIIALRKAAKYLKNYRLLDTTMYVTLEPCLMCFGAIITSRISRLVFSTYNKKFNTKLFIDLLNTYNINYSLKINSGILEEKCRNIIKNFFFLKRKKNNFLKKVY